MLCSLKVARVKTVQLTHQPIDMIPKHFLLLVKMVLPANLKKLHLKNSEKDVGVRRVNSSLVVSANLNSNKLFYHSTV